MGLWDTLRTAVNLAARVEEIERKCDAIELEWSDVLRILKKREERERKANARAVASSVEQGPPAPPLAPVGDRKAHLRALIKQRRTQGE